MYPILKWSCINSVGKKNNAIDRVFFFQTNDDILKKKIFIDHKYKALKEHLYWIFYVYMSITYVSYISIHKSNIV